MLVKIIVALIKSLKYIVIVAVLIGIGLFISAQIPNIKDALFGARTTKKVTVGTTVIEQIKSLQEFNTVQFYGYVKLKEYQKVDKRLWFDEELEVWVFVPGTVKAGIDFAELQPQDIITDTSDGQKIAVRLPPPRITSTELDTAQIEVWTKTERNVSASDGIQMFQGLQITATRNLQEQAIQGGILDLARDNARTSLTQFLRSLGYTEVRIIFEEIPPEGQILLPNTRLEPLTTATP